MKQENLDVTEYYMEMVWSELDLSLEYEWECVGESVRYEKKLENKKVSEFLVGLNKDLDNGRGRILDQ